MKEHKCILFLTTHSHVVIDLFSGDKDAQVIHVTHDETIKGLSRVDAISSHGHHSKVFDDLGVRASDLLQANCVIWVEGPSDRVYFNRWIELFDPELKEHDDYEFAFTGGTLLDHYAYSNVDENERIEALRINRNAIVLMDRDRTGPDDKLKAWVDRVTEELTNTGGFPWVTAGKEVENYIPVGALRSLLENEDLDPPDVTTSIFKFIKENGGRDYSADKVLLAQRISGRLDREALEGCLDLGTKMEEVCRRIRQWNARDSK